MSRPAVLSASLPLAVRAPLPPFILLLASLHVGVGMAALALTWATGTSAWIELFFRYPGAVLLVELACLELRSGLWVFRRFSPTEPLHTVWMFLAASAGCNLAGAICVEVLSAEVVFNPLARVPGYNAAICHDFGILLGGPLRLFLLAGGICFALRQFRRTGMRAKLRPVDWVVTSAAAACVAAEALDRFAALRAGVDIAPGAWIVWAAELLLAVMVVQAALLWRAARQFGKGLVARCWTYLFWAVLFTFAGTIGHWLTYNGYVPWPLGGLFWLLAFPTAAAFACAPAYQEEAMRRAAGLE